MAVQYPLLPHYQTLLPYRNKFKVRVCVCVECVDVHMPTIIILRKTLQPGIVAVAYINVGVAATSSSCHRHMVIYTCIQVQ